MAPEVLERALEFSRGELRSREIDLGLARGALVAARLLPLEVLLVARDLRRRLLAPPGPGEERPERVVRDRQVGLQLERPAIRALRLGGLARRLVGPSEIERDVGRLRIEARRRFELGERLRRLPAEELEASQAMPVRGAVRRSIHGVAEADGRLVEPADFPEGAPEVEVHFRARLPAPARLVELPDGVDESALVGEREAVVDAKTRVVRKLLQHALH